MRRYGRRPSPASTLWPPRGSRERGRRGRRPSPPNGSYRSGRPTARRLPGSFRSGHRASGDQLVLAVASVWMAETFVGHASVTINTSKAHVWDALVNPEKIKQHMPVTSVVSDWRGKNPNLRAEWTAASRSTRRRTLSPALRAILGL